MRKEFQPPCLETQFNTNTYYSINSDRLCEPQFFRLNYGENKVPRIILLYALTEIIFARSRVPGIEQTPLIYGGATERGFGGYVFI